MRKREPWYITVLALVITLGSGALFALSLKPGWSLVGWIMLFPMLAASRMTRHATAALFGICAALLAGWLLVGKASSPTESANAVFLFLGLALLFALMPMLSSFIARRTSPLLWALFVACAGTACEWLIDYFSPVSVALSLSQNRAALHLAAFTGIWGVSFLVWLISASCCTLLAKRRPTWPVLVFCVVILLAATCAVPVRPSDTVLPVAAVQAQLADYAAEETHKVERSAAVAVWPEYVLDPTDRTPYDAAKRDRVYVITTIEEHTRDKKPYNTAVFIGPDGRKIGSIRKRHLYGKEMMDFCPGKPTPPVQARGFKAGLAICYDTVFTDVVRDQARRGADVVFVPTGDPVVPGYLTHRLHAAMNAYRAAENGIPIVWASGFGLSTIFDASGQIVKQAEPDANTAIVAHVHLRRGTTMFTRAGDYFAYLSAAVAFSLATVILAMKRARP